MSIPALRLNSSPLKCGEAPMPVEANVTRLVFAESMNSCTDFAGEEFGTIMRLGMTVTSVTGARSLAGL